MAVFYVLFGLWWVGILSWLAYKMGLFSECCHPQRINTQETYNEGDVHNLERSKFLVRLAYWIGDNQFSWTIMMNEPWFQIDLFEPYKRIRCLIYDVLLQEWAINHMKQIRTVAFVICCVMVVVGFVLAVLQKVAFSMFILGVLTVALIVSTSSCKYIILEPKHNFRALKLSPFDLPKNYK